MKVLPRVCRPHAPLKELQAQAVLKADEQQGGLSVSRSVSGVGDTQGTRHNELDGANVAAKKKIQKLNSIKRLPKTLLVLLIVVGVQLVDCVTIRCFETMSLKIGRAHV